MNSNEGTPLINVAASTTRRSRLLSCNWTPVEILVVFHTAAVMALSTAQAYYILDITAKKYGQENIAKHADPSCHHFNHTNTSHVDNTSVIIQREAAEISMYLGFCASFGSVVPIFLMGYLTDTFGRRAVWICSVGGFLARGVILLVTMLLNLPIWVLYIGQATFALTGTYNGAMVTVFARVADVSEPGKKRAFRITVVQGIGMLTSAVTIYVMGYWVLTEKFYQPVIMTICFSVISVILGFFILKSSVEGDSQRREILAPLKIYFGNRFTRSAKYKLALCLLLFLLSSACLNGKLGYQTLFLMHTPVCWNALDVQIMHAIQTFLNTVCNIGLVRLILQYTDDVLVVVFGTISALISILLLGVSVNGVMVYLHVVFGVLSIAVFPVMRALMSKFVDPHEQGSLFASIACLDELVTAVSGIIFGKLYTATVKWFPGFIFLLMAGIFSFILVGSIVLNRMTRRQSTP